MSGIDSVIALLAELRSSGGMLGRATAVARGVAALREMSPAQRRELAIEVARRTAPQLVPRIQQETGLDLSPEQLTAVMDMVLRMDPHQLDELAGQLSTDVVADPSPGPDEGSARSTSPPAPPAQGPPTPEVAPDRPASPQSPVPATGATEPEAPEPVRTDAPPGTRDRIELGQPEAEVALVPLRDASAADDGPTGAQVQEPVVAHEAPVGGDVPDTTHAEDQAATSELVARLHAAGTARGRLSAFDAVGAGLWELGTGGRREVLAAIPDGWQRRRAIERMLRWDVVSASEAVEMILALERPSDRSWVAASMIEADLLDPADLPGLVDQRTAGRLARRYRAAAVTG